MFCLHHHFCPVLGTRPGGAVGAQEASVDFVVCKGNSEPPIMKRGVFLETKIVK